MCLDIGLESAESLYHRRVTHILASEFPMYFAIISQVRRDTSLMTATGAVLNSSTDPRVEAVVPSGAFRKNVRLSVQVKQC